mmetsp:Transcript_7972/g.26188  ORF Transcript_7972/g.26188 Transcript_7972/m.26188 type:complete len:263 (+) Transcript_7972:168-956(+)
MDHGGRSGLGEGPDKRLRRTSVGPSSVGKLGPREGGGHGLLLFVVVGLVGVPELFVGDPRNVVLVVEGEGSLDEGLPSVEVVGLEAGLGGAGEGFDEEVLIGMFGVEAFADDEGAKAQALPGFVEVQVALGDVSAGDLVEAREGLLLVVAQLRRRRPVPRVLRRFAVRLPRVRSDPRELRDGLLILLLPEEGVPLGLERLRLLQERRRRRRRGASRGLFRCRGLFLLLFGRRGKRLLRRRGLLLRRRLVLGGVHRRGHQLGL